MHVAQNLWLHSMMPASVISSIHIPHVSFSPVHPATAAWASVRADRARSSLALRFSSKKYIPPSAEGCGSFTTSGTLFAFFGLGCVVDLRGNLLPSIFLL